MQTATAPFILRSIYKDDYLSESRVVRPATDLLGLCFGAQWANQHDSYVESVCKGLYRFFSMVKGPTLGEEFCDLLPVTRGNPWRSVGITRIGILSTLIAVQPTALFHAARKLFPNVPPHDVTGNVHKVVLCFLFLFEAYGTLPHRLTRTRFLSLQPSLALAQGDGAPGSYLTLGLVLMVELVVRLWRYSKVRDSEKKRLTEEKAAMAAASSSDDEEIAKTGKCMLCLSHRKCPTATQCGHIFCWNCIAEWIRSNPSDAICPFCRQRITAPSLVPLFFYVANDPPKVGTAEDS